MKQPTPDEYFELISLTVRDMMIAGQTIRSEQGDEAIARFAYYLRRALGIIPPNRH